MGENKITYFGIKGKIETMKQRKTYDGDAVYISDSDIWSIGISAAECLMGKHSIQKTQFIWLMNYFIQHTECSSQDQSRNEKN
ncbi:unnamed protein product [Paramecium octaurelia]|uniref:Protein kinase domain-containing protein n=1 Tax=Paramecium octaurelia TaxID=43137 RepID=A0A8S1YKK8_PAROT|nr:unnamed protein product [Paramecium octaurelia]